MCVCVSFFKHMWGFSEYVYNILLVCFLAFPTRKVFSHSDLNVPTTSCSNAECINWQHVKRNIKGPLGTPCPCSLPQARADKLFKATPPDVKMACVEGKTYDSAGVKQVCCYDM